MANGNPLLHNLGLDTIKCITDLLNGFHQQHSSNLKWFDEILQKSKQAFGSSTIELLPKTPSTKRSKRKIKSKIHVTEPDDVFLQPPAKRSLVKESPEKVEDSQPKRTYRTRAASKSTLVNSKASQPAHTKKTKSKQSGEPTPVNTSLNNKDKRTLSVNQSPAGLLSEKHTSNVVQQTPENSVKSPIPPRTVTTCKTAGPGHVRNKVTAYEELIEASSPTKTPQKSCLTPRHETEGSVPETPEDSKQETPATPATVKVQVSKEQSSTPNVNDTLNHTLTLENSMNTSSSISRKSCRRSTRSGHRKSLKTLHINIPGKKHQVSRLRLKKKDNLQNSKTVSEDATSCYSENEYQSSAETVEEEIKQSYDSNSSTSGLNTSSDKIRRSGLDTKDPLRHTPEQTQSGNRKSLEVLLSDTKCVSHTSDDEQIIEQSEKTALEDDSDSDDSIMLISDTDSPKQKPLKQRDSANDGRQKVAEAGQTTGEEEKPEVNSTYTKQGNEASASEQSESENEAPVRSTRTKQRKGTSASEQTESENEAPVRSTRTKQRKETSSSEHTESENEAPVRSTRTKQRKPTSASEHTESENEAPVRSTRTKQRKPTSASEQTESENEASVRSTRTKQRKETSSSEQTESENEAPVRSTRTKQRKNQTTSSSSDSAEEILAKPVRASTRTKQRKNTVTSSVSSVDESCEMDSGIQSEKSSHSIEIDGPRGTRSKMRKATKSVNSDTNENEDKFRMPDTPPVQKTRTKTRKRQLDKDDSLDVSLSKKSCIQMSDTSQDASPGYSSNNDEQNERRFSRESIKSPQIINHTVPSFRHNLSNKIGTPLSYTMGIKSFIQRNTPPLKMSRKDEIEKKKKELQEKQKKDQARLVQRDVMLKMRIEEQRRKREERMKKVAEMRSEKEKQDLEQKSKNQRRLEEKRQLTEKLREEQQREEKEKHQKIRMKKLQELEERRKQEEEERLRKIKEQQEEERKIQEILQKKKEAEMEERQRRILEEKRRQEERLAELEKERLAEKERKKRQMEEEKQREIQRQRQKEEKERAIARAQAEKERLEQERKLQKEMQLKKADEARQKRLMWEEEQKEKKRKEEMELQNMIKNHNAQFAALNSKTAAKQAQDTLPKPNLNTTHNVPKSNPDSYEMTPVRKYKPKTHDNYDISDLRSDDSTDDEDHPHKQIPSWASGPNLKALLINQHYNPPDLESLFEAIEPPDLNILFVKKKPRFNKRTSSAHWDSPILKPSNNYLS